MIAALLALLLGGAQLAAAQPSPVVAKLAVEGEEDPKALAARLIADQQARARRLPLLACWRGAASAARVRAISPPPHRQNCARARAPSAAPSAPAGGGRRAARHLCLLQRPGPRLALRLIRLPRMRYR